MSILTATYKRPVAAAVAVVVQSLLVPAAGAPKQPLPVSITAGFEGATLLVCPSQSPSAAAAVAEPPLLPAASGSTQMLLPSSRSAAISSSQMLPQGSGSVGVKPSGPTRHSPGSLARISPAALGAPVPSKGLGPSMGPGHAGLGAGGVHRTAQNTYSRRNLAAAVAAVDALMEPFPGLAAAATAAIAAGGGGGRLGPPAAGAASGADATPGRAANGPAAAVAAAGAAGRLSRLSPAAAGGGMPPLARTSQGLLQGGIPVLARKSQGQEQGGVPSLARRSQELQQQQGGSSRGSGEQLPSLQRTSSNTPLAGAQGDNAVTLGVDMRGAGPMGALGAQDVASAAAAEHASGSLYPDGERTSTPAAAAADSEQHGGRAQQGRQQFRRSKSQRPLRAGVGTATGERRVGGGGGGTSRS